MIFRERDVVRLVGLGTSLWCIEELGAQTFYASGGPLTEAPTRLSLFLPALHRPRCAYAQQTTAHRKFMIQVAPMEVLAMVSAAPSDREHAEMTAKWKARLRRLRQLQVQAATFKKYREWSKAQERLKKFVEANSDLFQSQATVEADWKVQPPGGARRRARVS